MNQLHCQLPDITLTKPKGLSRRMFFHAYSGPNAIGFAQLSSRSSNEQRRSVPAEFEGDHSTAPAISFCLKKIEVRQNYRNLGVGSALLEEIINFCQEERIAAIYGEARGELEILRRWYRGKGFQLDAVDNIRLSVQETTAQY